MAHEKLTADAIRDALTPLDGWSLDGERIVATYKFKDFYRTMSFVNAVAHLANVENHHPDLAVSYGSCEVALTTHDAGGVTASDLAMATKIAALPR